MTTQTTTVTEQLETFRAAVEAAYVAHFTAQGYRLAPPTIAVEPGRKYARVITVEPGTRSAYCFVDMANGDIYKADGWKRPAKGVRGTIYNLKSAQAGTGGFYSYR